MLNGIEIASNEDVRNIFNDFKNAPLRQQPVDSMEHCQIKWNTGGFAYGGIAFDCKVFDAPSNKKENNLKDYIFAGYPEDKYFLSATAAKGILRRADNQKRQLFAPFRKALERLSQAELAKAI